MDNLLLLAQLIKNGDLGSSGGGGGSTDTLVLDYDCNDIFYGWVNPDENHPDYYLLEAGHEDTPGEFVEDPLYNELAGLLIDWNTLTNLTLAKHKVICCGSNNCGNVILENFRKGYTTNTIICDINYFGGGYWGGVLKGKMTIKFDSGNNNPKPLNLYLDTEYGVNTLDYNRGM